MARRVQKEEEKKKRARPKAKPNKRGIVKTHDGHALTPQEEKFIDNYVETGNGLQSVIEAGYKCKSPRQYAQTLLNKDYIADEIKFRLEEIQSKKTASAKEVMEYFTSVMRGEIKDQFGLEAPLSERTRAAQELAKRTIDIPNKLSGKAEAEVKITLNWERAEEGTEE